MSRVASVLPSLTTMTSKSGVRRLAVCTARMTRLAIVPPSLYAGKKYDRPGGLPGLGCDMSSSALNRISALISGQPTQGEPEREQDGLRDDPPRQLRLSSPALDEGDRYLGDARTRTPRVPGHLHLEGIAVGPQP